MKKLLLTGIIIMLSIQIFGLEIIAAGNKIQIELSDLEKMEQITLETHLVKDGQPKDDKWQGIDLVSLLEKNEVTKYDQIKFYSQDNYMVRLNHEQILQHKPIIALNRNGDKLTADKIRLVVPEMRDMFWIRGIATLETESAFELKFSHNIMFAEKYLASKDMHKLEPFKDAKGFTFAELISESLPMDQKYYVIGRDGVAHWFDYQNYLAQAVLIENDGKFDMKSVQMPAGMWIDNIAIIVVGAKAIVFQNQFEQISQVMELLQKAEYPQNITIRSATGSTKISVETPFADSKWNNIPKIIW